MLNQNGILDTGLIYMCVCVCVIVCVRRTESDRNLGRIPRFYDMCASGDQISQGGTGILLMHADVITLPIVFTQGKMVVSLTPSAMMASVVTAKAERTKNPRYT